MELFLIAYAARRCTHANHPFTKEKLDQVVRGPDEVEGRDTKARDTEFELAIAARLALDGLQVFAGEPDLRVLLASELVGVAVKRITSPEVKQLKEAIKGAVHQIGGTGLNGILALNLEHRLQGLASSASDNELLALAEEVYDSVAALGEY
jgi:hypothetical protein